jgi:import inner membrane translocase subunit TIM23
LYYAAIDSLVGHYTAHEYPSLGAVVAGAGAGSLYKSMNGVRAAAVYGVVGAGLSAANQAGQYMVGFGAASRPRW